MCAPWRAASPRHDRTKLCPSSRPRHTRVCIIRPRDQILIKDEVRQRQRQSVAFGAPTLRVFIPSSNYEFHQIFCEISVSLRRRDSSKIRNEPIENTLRFPLIWFARNCARYPGSSVLVLKLQGGGTTGLFDSNLLLSLSSFWTLRSPSKRIVRLRNYSLWYLDHALFGKR